MSKLSKALGEKYEENRLSVLTRQFQLGDHTFKVRVPSVLEIEAIYNYADNPNNERVELEYKNIIAGFEKDEIDGDVVIEGRSMRETAKNKEVLKYRIIEYFKFIIPEIGTLDDLTYEDIETEFPLGVQLTIVEKINEVISPDYRDSRLK